jgi:S1-C subfamily serine protease
MRDILIVTMILTSFVYGQAPVAQHKAQQHPTALADMIDRIRGCVVRVSAISEGEIVSTGTGFLVNDDGIVVTAAHVIHPPNAVPPLAIRIQMRVPTIHGKLKLLTSWSGSDATIIAEDAAHDVIALRPLMNVFAKHTFVPPGITILDQESVNGRFDAHRLRDGEALFTSGYPLGLPILITTSGNIASSDPMTFEPDRRNLKDTYLVDMHVNPGNSGGPMFSTISGDVIGMVDAYEDAPIVFTGSDDQGYGLTKGENGTYLLRPLASNSGIALIVPARYIVELLRSKGIRYDFKK